MSETADEHTKAQLTLAMRAILETNDIEGLTVKTVRLQLAEQFPDYGLLSQRSWKDWIKETLIDILNNFDRVMQAAHWDGLEAMWKSQTPHCIRVRRDDDDCMVNFVMRQVTKYWDEREEDDGELTRDGFQMEVAKDHLQVPVAEAQGRADLHCAALPASAADTTHFWYPWTVAFFAHFQARLAENGVPAVVSGAVLHRDGFPALFQETEVLLELSMEGQVVTCDAPDNGYHILGWKVNVHGEWQNRHIRRRRERQQEHQ